MIDSVRRSNITIKVAVVLTLACLIAVSPSLVSGIPHVTAASQSFYPDFNTSSACGYGLDSSLPSSGAHLYYGSSFSIVFCGIANQTLDLTNASLSLYFSAPTTYSVSVIVGLLDNGTVIAESSSTPANFPATAGECSNTPQASTFHLSPSNGGVMKDSDQLTLEVNVTGVSYMVVAPCTGSTYPSTFSIAGTPVTSSNQGNIYTPQECKSLLSLPYQQLSAGSKVTEFYAPRETFTAPKVANWMWYFVPSNGQNPNSTATQVVSQLWASGHGQNFNWFIGTYSGNVGVVLMTDYALVYGCSSK
jgi:hypothetical protein